MKKENLKTNLENIEKLQNLQNLHFKSSPISIIDNTFRLSWFLTVLVITNFAIIVSKINEFNEKLNVTLHIDTNLLIIILLLVFIILVLIYYIIEWKIFKIELDDNKITVYKNIVIKDRYIFLLKNISGYVIEQNILDKIFKVYRFKIYTERIYNSKADTEFVVKKDLSKKINDVVLSRITNIKSEEITFDEASNFNIKLNLKEIFIHSLLNISVKNSFIILNVILLIFTMIKEETIAKEIMTNLLGFIMTILIIVFPILYNLIISILKFYNYKLKKFEEFLIVKYGLFTTKKYFIPITKVKGFVLRETLISRIFNYSMLQVICSGIANKKGELNFLLPMTNKKKLSKAFKIILPNIEICFNNKLKNQASFSISIFMVLLTILSIIAIPTLMFFRIKTVYIITYMIIALLMILIFYFFKRISISEKYILISTGVIIKKISVILYDSIKYIKINEGIISNKLNINRLSIYITSSFGNLKHGLGYVTNNTLNKVKEKYLT